MVKTKQEKIKNKPVSPDVGVDAPSVTLDKCPFVNIQLLNSLYESRNQSLKLLKLGNDRMLGECLD